MNAWDNLSLTEKSDMIRVAVENGITTLPEIRKAYNEFAEGGGVDTINTYETGGYKPSESIKSRIAQYEGKAMTGARDPISGKWGKNNSFEAEAKGFYKALPVSIREQVLSNPELADSLYSYSYNVGAGNFKKRVVPALERYYAGIGSVKDIEDSMWATHDSKLRGLQRRRAEEKAGVRNALMGEAMPLLQTEELPEFTPFNPQAFSAFMGVDGNCGNYVAPQVMDVEEPLIQAAIESTYSPEQIEREERAQGLRNLGLAMSIMRVGQSPTEDSSLWDTVGLLTGSQYKNGGKIHIKPENRGKFTALKKRTGHSATWFKEHGTPAQKKMATFALNSRHWKHGLGGNLFSGEDELTQQMNNGLNLYRRTNNLGETEYIYQETPDSEEILLTPTNRRFSDDPTNWDYKDASGREYSPRMTTTYNPGEIREDTRGPLERMADNYFGELKYQLNNNVPISGKYTMPAIAATPFLAWTGEAAYPYVSAALANPYVDAGISSTFAGHGLNHAINEGIDGWGDAAMTALELMPLGRLAKPVYVTPFENGTFKFDNIVGKAFEKQPQSIDEILNRLKEPKSILTSGQNARISNYANDPRDPAALMDIRLKNGGADRLKADNRVAFSDTESKITEYMPYERSTFLPQITEAIQEAEKIYGRKLTVKEITDMADMITNGESFALKGTPYGFVSKTLPRRRFEIERGHEKGHTKIRLKSYSSPLPKNFLENRWGKGNYMVEGNGDEQAIRFSQFKAYLGKDDISAEELKYISENYVKDTGVDNNITDLFDAIKDYSKEHPQIWEEMAKWGTEIAPVGLATLYLRKE